MWKSLSWWAVEEHSGIVIGAGIIGASIAWRLAERGQRVLLVDAGRFGCEASSAGAGMLAPGGELSREHGWAHLAVESLRMYPDYVVQLERASGAQIDFRLCGGLELAMGEIEWSQLQERASRQRAIGIRSEAVAPAEAAARAPGLVLDGVSGAMWYPDDAAVEPRDVMAALRLACVRAGVEIREQCRVNEVRSLAGRAEVVADERVETAGAVVIAAGAWSGEVAVKSDGQYIDTPRSLPIRGHLAAYRVAPGTLGPIVRHGSTYLVQRNNGRLLVGATEEEVGFDRRVEPEAVCGICSRAAALLPGPLSRDPDESWIGFRPATESRAPEIRRLENTRVWLAYGHYRNGILLAPATADLVANGILS